MIKATSDNIILAAEIIRGGGLVAFPTETVYGLGADALNPVAVAGIFEAKKRPFFDPLIVHIADLSALDELVIRPDPRAIKLAGTLWPGPITIVFPKSSLVPDIVTAGLNTVAVRMPSHPVAQSLIRLSGTSIAAPSANPFGYISPTRARHVEKQLGNTVDIILDGGPCSVGLESTIIKFDQNGVHLLRPGGISIEDIEAITGPVNTARSAVTESPGQLPVHYSPHTRVLIISDIADAVEKNAALLSFRGTASEREFRAIEILSPSGDLREAAARLFSALHALDECGAQIIYAESLPENGLGRAIMDRLRRAAEKNP